MTLPFPVQSLTLSELIIWHSFLDRLEVYLSMGVVSPEQVTKLTDEINSVHQAVSDRLTALATELQNAAANATAGAQAEVQTLVDNAVSQLEDIKKSVAPIDPSPSSPSNTPLEQAATDVNAAAQAPTPGS